MYDWPEVAPALDCFWSDVRERLRRDGVHAPDGLTRDADLDELWSDPDVVVDQVCSLNPVREGAGTVVVLGTLDHRPPPDLPGCAPGEYYSVVVCRADDPRRQGGVAAFAGAAFAANGTDSQSGYWSLGHHLITTLGPSAPTLGRCELTGSHRASIRCVASGRADLAAIDVHSWRLALRHEPLAAHLAPIATTDPTPGVVCVTGERWAGHAARIRGALAEAADAAAATVSGAELGIAGWVTRTVDDFAVVGERVAAAAAVAWHR